MDSVLENDELPKARKVLIAAALTYVAALLASIYQLIRLVGLSRRR
jgi:Zn-dependent membrane protease YugP